MQLKISKEEADFLSFLIEERRSQVRAIAPLWHRHHRQDAKRIIDGFPYEKGELIPYIKRCSAGEFLVWDATTHQDLVADLRDHLAEINKAENESEDRVVVVHKLLQRIEALAEEVNKEMQED